MIPARTRNAPNKTRGEGASPTIAQAAKMPTGSSLDAMIDTMPVVSLGLAKLIRPVGNKMPRMANPIAKGHVMGSKKAVV